ncbi:antibiotic biosynthesis monooxygenase [Auritidibacter sp. NML100628]|uniref:antibiotic biosynthesis monooxygenase family protein n=1 Tax=Auritidibacter sp. NML100628 TaxID=2170742 RepID=UPI001F3E337D|nr:antibiotic biosynthesis monooxygenase [Auritidibacter sp. NML100628]
MTDMTFVNITALTVPDGAHNEVERRFANRKRDVDTFEGFQGFEVLRPVVGETRYFVVTRWDSQNSYKKWAESRDEHAHDEDEERGFSVDILGFDVVEDEENLN